MHEVRGPGTEEVNMLDLGPLHQKVQKHMEAVIANPEILLPNHGTYKSGSMDGKPWYTPEAVEAVKKLSPSLPHLKPLLVAFFKGALSAWKRFSMEFDEDGQIHGATASEKKRAHRPPKTDDNEGATKSHRL